MAGSHWTCPFCGRDTTITEHDSAGDLYEMKVRNSVGPCILLSNFVVCPNPKCKKYTLNVTLYECDKEWIPEMLSKNGI